MKIFCTCGHINYFQTETEHEFFLISDDLFFETLDGISSGQLDRDGVSDKIVFEGIEVYRCEKCLRLYMYGKKNGQEIQYQYALEKMWEEGDEEEDKDQQ